LSEHKIDDLRSLLETIYSGKHIIEHHPLILSLKCFFFVYISSQIRTNHMLMIFA